MRCSVNRLLQLATKPRLQSMRSDTSSHVWPSASSKISRARRASSARFVRLLARRVSSITSEFDNVMASLMDTIIVYKWLLQSTRCDTEQGNHSPFTFLVCPVCGPQPCAGFNGHELRLVIESTYPSYPCGKVVYDPAIRHFQGGKHRPSLDGTGCRLGTC